MIDRFLNLFKRKDMVAEVLTNVETAKANIQNEPKPKKPRKPRAPKPKKEAPNVDILKFDFDPENPKIGSLELDWNTEFVELLVKHGYNGASEEDIVDAWLNDVCKTILMNQFPGAAAQPNSMAATKTVNRKDVGGGLTEVS